MSLPYVTPLHNFPEVPFSHLYNESDFPEYYHLTDPSIMHDDIHQILAEFNLGIDKVSIFRSYGHEVHGIHTDSVEPSDIAKIVWMFGPKHTMYWYKVKPGALGEVGLKVSKSSSVIASHYSDYDVDDVELAHGYDIKGPVLLQAGVPHNVVNYEGERTSFTIVPKVLDHNKNITGRCLTMLEALAKFRR